MIDPVVLQIELFGAFFFLVFLAFLMVAIHIGMVVWTYSEAGRHSDDSAALWASRRFRRCSRVHPVRHHRSRHGVRTGDQPPIV
jgi:cbb3-type cytochrome oxidase subunit 3